MPKGVQPIEFKPGGINMTMIYAGDLVQDPLPKPDHPGVPCCEVDPEEDELWAQLGDVSPSDKEILASGVLDDEDFWSYFEDISLLLDGMLLP